MHTPLLVLGALIIIPVVVFFVLRINAALVFLSLCLGDVLSQFIDTKTGPVANLIGSHHAASVVLSNDRMVHLSLLLVPTILTAVFMVRTVSKGARQIINVLPALGVGLLGALLIVPLLSSHLAETIIVSSSWHQLVKLQSAAVTISAIVCLVVLWLLRPKSGGGHGDEKHSKHHA